MTIKSSVFFKVLMAKGHRPRSHSVLADYYKVEAGAVIFRRTVALGYPEVIATFAAGCWESVWLDNGEDTRPCRT